METTETKAPEADRAALANWYRGRVEDLAARLRPLFAAGELKGWNDEDGCPVSDVEAEVAEAIPDAPTAYLMLAASPAEALDVDDAPLTDARQAAAGGLLRNQTKAEVAA